MQIFRLLVFSMSLAPTHQFSFFHRQDVSQTILLNIPWKM
ncbi:UNVERIFIED_CONTAM: hypothetical protein GTU68_064207 [Idotea baltica]|nr:hypothetical protein [Idotea baltica]